jgi:small-conductance mechanosensitive channel
VWYVRNGTVQRVGNKSQGFAVAVVDLPLAYTTNVSEASELVSRVATEAAEQSSLAEDVLEPPEVLGVESVATDSITLRITVKVRPGRQFAVQRTLRAQLMAALGKAGFEPPLAQPPFNRTQT